MTQLLISVKNVQEAMLVLAADVDIVDLKDPNFGALGALDMQATKEIVHLVDGKKMVSATVGELHTSVGELMADIQLRADADVDIVKIAVSELFQQAAFYDEIVRLTKNGLRIVAVFFADEAIDVQLLPQLKNAGFYGAMLDTKNKQQNLRQTQDANFLNLFTQLCRKNDLSVGLAGSLRAQDVDFLQQFNPTYIGFRGGVCKYTQRKSALDVAKLHELTQMLLNGNKNSTNAQLILGLALHS